jgi:hypothetical protein
MQYLKNNYAYTIIDRLKQYFMIDSDVELGKIFGLKQQTISAWRSRNTFDIHVILEKAQNINLNWLFFGEGTMLRQSDIASDRTASYLVSPEELRRLRSLEKKVKELQEFL